MCWTSDAPWTQLVSICFSNAFEVICFNSSLVCMRSLLSSICFRSLAKSIANTSNGSFVSSIFCLEIAKLSFNRLSFSCSMLSEHTVLYLFRFDCEAALAELVDASLGHLLPTEGIPETCSACSTTSSASLSSNWSFVSSKLLSSLSRLLHCASPG